MSVRMKERQYLNIDQTTQAWFQSLSQIVGEENIITRFCEKLAYGRDRWPRSNLKYRFGKFPLTDPYLVVVPGTEERLIEMAARWKPGKVQWANTGERRRFNRLNKRLTLRTPKVLKITWVG